MANRNASMAAMRNELWRRGVGFSRYAKRAELVNLLAENGGWSWAGIDKAPEPPSRPDDRVHDLVRTLADMDPDNDPTDPDDWRETLVNVILWAQELRDAGVIRPAR